MLMKPVPVRSARSFEVI